MGGWLDLCHHEDILSCVSLVSSLLLSCFIGDFILNVSQVQFKMPVCYLWIASLNTMVLFLNQDNSVLKDMTSTVYYDLLLYSQSDSCQVNCTL